MTYYFRSGNTYNISDSKAIDVREHLDGGNYVVKFDEQKQIFFLEGIEDFTLPSKIYGDTVKMTDRVFTTFMSRDSSTGVLLVGEKGSGKTLLSKSLSVKLKEHDMPTLVINSPFCGDMFNKFVQTIEQPCAILFDEFEKIYDKEDQEKMLTLLDGVFPSKKLFLLTTNGTNVDQHMKNRPGRVFYYLEYFGLEESFIREYCDDNLIDKSEIDRIVSISSCFSAFNFDMLKAVVEEMNRYGESVSDAMKILNARLENDTGTTQYKIVVYVNGKEIDNRISPQYLQGSPLASSRDQWICIYSNDKLDGDEYDEDSMTLEEKIKIDLFLDSPDIQLSEQLLQKIEKGGSISYKIEQHGVPVVIQLVKQERRNKFHFDAF